MIGIGRNVIVRCFVLLLICKIKTERLIQIFMKTSHVSKVTLGTVCHWVCLAFLCLLFMSTSTRAQSSWNQLGADIDGSMGDGLGASIAISSDGQTLAVGVPSASEGSFKGLVQIYDKSGASWIQRGADIVGEVDGDNFGSSVSMSDDGNMIAIGAPFKDLTSSFAPNGRVQVYEWNGTSWVQKGSNIDGVADFENLGEAISLSGDGTRLAVGIPGKDTNGATEGGQTGAVQVYEFSTDWTPLGSEIAGSADFDTFGSALDLDQSGNSLAVGAPANATGGSNAGQVTVYRWNSTSWENKGTTNHLFDGGADDALGKAVSLSDDGDRLAIGAPDSFFGFGPTYIGYAQVWDYASETWTQVGSDIISNFDGDGFGQRLALSGDGTHLVIGATSNFDTNNPNGRAQIWSYNSTTWEQVGDDITGEAADDIAGTAVSISTDGTIVAVGAPSNDGGGADSGHAQVFEFGVLDTAAPTVTITSATSTTTNANPIAVSIEFSETVVGFDVSDLTIGNGTATNFQTASGTEYTVDIVPTADGTVTLNIAAAAAQDASGNDSAAATEFTRTYDGTGPTVDIAFSTGTTNVSPVVATITFSEEIGLLADDLTVTGGTITDLSTTDNIIYTAEVTPEVPADAANTGFEITLALEAGKVQDAAGNINLEGAETTILFDDVVPVASFSAAAATGDFQGVITFSELANSSLSESDIEITNGTLSNYLEIPGSNGAILFALGVTVETGTEEILISIPSGVVTDAAGNANEATIFTVAIDNVAPTVVVTSTAENPTNISPIPVKFTFSEKVTRTPFSLPVSAGFSLGELMTEDSLVYTADITPSVEAGTLSLTVSAQTFKDLAGNDNVSSETFTLEYDTKSPVLTIDAPEAVNSTDPFAVTFSFDEAVASFDASNVTVTNATLGAITADGNTYTSQVTPGVEGDITITVTGVADELGNAAEEASKTIAFDATAPTVTITGMESGATVQCPDAITITFSFSEDVTGFESADIAVTNSSVSNFNDANAPVFTADITPTEEGTITISIAENAAQDAVGNGNEAVTLSYNYVQKYSGGCGTEANPYLIANEEDLRELSNSSGDWGGHFLQSADIHMSNEPFSPIGRHEIRTSNDGSSTVSRAFRGIYDGGGFIISGLNCSSLAVASSAPVFFSGNYYIHFGSGLFGTLNGEIRNLGIVNPSFSTSTTEAGAGGENYVGLVAACEQGTAITNTFIEVNTELTKVNFGGLVGGHFGGLLTVKNSYAKGRISFTGSSGWSAGLVGFGNVLTLIKDGLVIENSYALITSNATNIIAPLHSVPLSSSTNGVIINNTFWDLQLSSAKENEDQDTSLSTQGTSLSTTDMRKRETYANAGWDFDDVWFHHGTGYHPVLKWQVDNAKPFTVSGSVLDKDGEPFSAGTAKALFITAPTKTVDLAEDGSFTLEDIPGLIHSIVIEPDANETEHVKTFYGDANRSTLSRHVYNSVSSIQIQMIAKSDPNLLTGNGVVNGRVVSAANGSGGRIVQGRILEGEGLEGVTVFLVRTSDEEILTQVETDKNGDFEISGIPAGEYQLLLDVVGIDVNLEGSSFTMDEEGTPLTISAAVSEEGISFAIEKVLGVADEIEVSIYPNPVQDFLHVRMQGSATLRLLDLSGHIILEKTFTDETFIDVRDLVIGVHLIEVVNHQGRSVRKLVKDN